MQVRSRLESLRSLLAAGSLVLAACVMAAPGAHAQARDDASVQAPAQATEAALHSPARKAARPGPLADFGTTPVSDAVRQMANWAFFTRDNQGRSVVILDKQAATVYAFDPQGKLFASAPALLGLTVGDDTVPGVGDKPLSEVQDDEKTTPAGRFVAQTGEDDSGVDVVWIDYDAAVAMHRVIDKVRAERRPERLASPNPQDRRISFGCINLPIPFYEQVLSPTVRKTGAIVYVLPEVHTLHQVFGLWDVTDPSAHRPLLASAPLDATPLPALPPHRLREPQKVLTSGPVGAQATGRLSSVVR